MAPVISRSEGMSPWSPDVMPTPGFLWPQPDPFKLDPSIDDPGPGRRPSPRLLLDMYETPADVLVDLALPGVSPEELDVQVEDLVLSIRGRYGPGQVQGQENGARYWVKSLPGGEFLYRLTLPVKVIADQVEAILESGMLHLHLPKAPEARTRKIEIKRSEPAKTLS